MTARGVRAFLFALFAAFALVTPTAAASEERCGATKMLYGKQLRLSVHGKGIECAEVERITRGKCDLDPDKTWGCFSFRAKHPVLVWFKTKEMFAERLSGWIEAHRPACSRSRVSAGDWKRAGNAFGTAFPTERQVLADDLVRCRQLRGMRYAGVTKLLGKPDELDRIGGRRTAYWELGLERDSFFQIDGEYLVVRFDRNRRFRSAHFAQG